MNFRNTALQFSKVLLAIITLGAIYVSVDITAVFQTLKNSEKLLILASIPFYLLTRILKMYIWRINLSTQDIHINNLKSIKSIFAAGIPAFIAPGTIGSFARPAYLKDKHNIPLKNGLPAFILEQFLSVTCYSIVILLLSLITLRTGQHQVTIILTGILGAFITAQLAFLYLVFGEKHTEIIGKLPLFTKILENRKHLKKSFKAKNKIIKSITLQLLVYIGTVGITTIILLSGLKSSSIPIYSGLITSSVQSLSLIPITPSGLGTVELSGVYLMKNFSITTEIATLFFLLHRVIPLSINIPAGLVVSWEWIDSKK